jgi:hypothetical protein
VLVTRWRAGAQDLVAAELQAELKALELELEATLGGLVARASTRCVTGVGLREVELPAVDVDVADPVPVPRRETPGGDPGVGTRLGRRLVEAGGDPATWANMPVALLRVALVLVGSVFEVQSLRRSREQEEARQRVAESLAAWNRAAALALAEAVRSARAGAERRIGAALEERLAALTEVGPAAAPARPEEQAALAAARDGLAEALVALGSAGVAG